MLRLIPLLIITLMAGLSTGCGPTQAQLMEIRKQERLEREAYLRDRQACKHIVNNDKQRCADTSPSGIRRTHFTIDGHYLSVRMPAKGQAKKYVSWTTVQVTPVPESLDIIFHFGGLRGTGGNAQWQKVPPGFSNPNYWSHSGPIRFHHSSKMLTFWVHGEKYQIGCTEKQGTREVNVLDKWVETPYTIYKCYGAQPSPPPGS